MVAHNTKWLTPRERDIAEWRMMQDGNRTRGKIVWGVLFRRLLDWRLAVNITIYICKLADSDLISNGGLTLWSCHPRPGFVHLHHLDIHSSYRGNHGVCTSPARDPCSRDAS